jgi:hypothetical protein
MLVTSLNGSFTQRPRLLGLRTPLGDDPLLVQSLFVQEALSSLFQVNLGLLAPGPGTPDRRRACGSAASSPYCPATPSTALRPQV